MPTVICTGHDNVQRSYEFEIEESVLNGKNVWTYYVSPTGENPPDKYQISVTEIDENFVKITMMTRNNQELYRGKRITQSMIPVIGRILGKNVISSSRDKLFKLLPEEDRNPTADAVWNDLVEKNLAIYISCYDFYLNLPNGD